MHRSPTRFLLQISPWALALVIVVLSALAVRLYGINWDESGDLHPDELFVARIVLIDRIHLDWPLNVNQLLDPARSGLNPRSADPATGLYREFAYGALPLWITDFSAWILSHFSTANWNASEHAHFVGRFLSALLSALTLIPIALMGRMVGDDRTGLLAAFIAAIAPMSIQLAHFFTTDSWLTFFVALSLWATIRAAIGGSVRRFALAGAIFGLAMATKGSVITLAMPIVIAALYWAVANANIHTRIERLSGGAFRLLTAALASLAAFFLFEPYALLRPDVYITSLRTQADIVSGNFDVPFTRVYAGTAPILYQIEQFLRWGYGPVAGALALVGIAMLAATASRGRSVASVILIGWLISYGTVISVAEVKFLRYLEPLSPVLAIAAAVAFLALTDRLAAWRRVHLTYATATLLLFAMMIWPAAFLSIYAHENPRIAATKWIYGSIPPGSTLSADYWDDALPRTFSFTFSPIAFGFGTETLDPYRDRPQDEASAALFDGLQAADYVVQSSRRVEAAIAAAPWRYPVQGQFFRLLESGAMGFTPLARFQRIPTLFGLSFNDAQADESFINYDHPEVSIYGKEREVDRAAFDAGMAWALPQPWTPARAAARPTLRLDTPVGENPSTHDARWSAALTANTLGAAVVWIVLLVALLAAGLPIAFALFGRFPDAGWGFARLLSWVLAAYLIWIGASLRVFQFRAIWSLLALALVAAIAWVAWYRGTRPGDVHLRWRFHPAALHAEAAFWLVFAIFLIFRLILPDSWHPFWGGEKPMEFALINAIGRTAYFPPYDPWFADGYVNYYYLGFYLIAFLGKVTGIPFEFAFNLALPTMMGLLASGAFSLGAVLARGLTRTSRLAIPGGWFAVAALCLVGNLTTARALLAGVSDVYDPFGQWVWNGSRAIDNAITEFPFFSGLYADLHSHLVALPITLLAIGLCYSIADHSRYSSLGRDRVLERRLGFNLAALALVLGTLSATNAWDVPVYALLGITSIFMASSTIQPFGRRALWFIASSTAVTVGAYLLFLPFHRHFVALFSQIAVVRDPTDLLQFLAHLGAFVAVVSVGLTLALLGNQPVGRNSAVLPFTCLAILLGGFFLVSAATSNGLEALGEAAVSFSVLAGPLLMGWRRASSTVEMSRSSQVIVYVLLVAALTCAGIAIALGRPVLGLTLALALISAASWLLFSRLPERFVSLLVAAAFFVAAGAEVVVVADDLIGTTAYRMNTVFKFYNQVWILLALSSAAFIALMAARSGLFAPTPSSQPPHTTSNPILARFGLGLATILFLASLLYPALAIGPRLDQRFVPGTVSGTLDALRWMDAGTVPVIGAADASAIHFAGDAAAIAWLQDNVTGTPVVAEASIGPYRCNGTRIANATGLPTIIGWERHQQQQRYPEELPQRVEDVRTLYTSPDIRQKDAILRKYNVGYVVVGELERLYPLANNECTPTGSNEGILAFKAMVGTTLKEVFSSNGTTIYRVLPPVSAQ